MKQTFKTWTEKNQYWITPLNTFLIILGILFGAYQRYIQLDNQDEIKSGISIQLKNDSVFKKKQDSALSNSRELRELIKKK